MTERINLKELRDKYNSGVCDEDIVWVIPRLIRIAKEAKACFGSQPGTVNEHKATTSLLALLENVETGE